MDIRQTRPLTFGAQFKVPIFAVTPSREPIRLQGFVRRPSIASVPLRNTYWLSNKAVNKTKGVTMRHQRFLYSVTMFIALAMALCLARAALRAAVPGQRGSRDRKSTRL